MLCRWTVCLFAGFARRQAVQSTSSGEAEFYGAGSVVMDGRVVKYVLQWLDCKVDCALLLDSSAAKAMVHRDGVGKVEHLTRGRCGSRPNGATTDS